MEQLLWLQSLQIQRGKKTHELTLLQNSTKKLRCLYHLPINDWWKFTYLVVQNISSTKEEGRSIYRWFNFIHFIHPWVEPFPIQPSSFTPQKVPSLMIERSNSFEGHGLWSKDLSLASLTFILHCFVYIGLQELEELVLLVWKILWLFWFHPINCLKSRLY